VKRLLDLLEGVTKAGGDTHASDDDSTLTSVGREGGRGDSCS
jgi:hypothetical protein